MIKKENVFYFFLFAKKGYDLKIKILKEIRAMWIVKDHELPMTLKQKEGKPVVGRQLNANCM